MIGSEKHFEPMGEQQVQKSRHEIRLIGPLANLVMHSSCSKFHAVHNPVDLVDN